MLNATKHVIMHSVANKICLSTFKREEKILSYHSFLHQRPCVQSNFMAFSAHLSLDMANILPSVCSMC